MNMLSNCAKRTCSGSVVSNNLREAEPCTLQFEGKCFNQSAIMCAQSATVSKVNLT